MEDLADKLPMPDLVDVRELGEQLSVKPKTIYDWVHRYEETGIPHYKLGSLVRFDPDEIAGWLRERHRAKMPARRSA